MHSRLFEAVNNNDESSIVKILEQISDRDRVELAKEVDSKGNTCLHIAVIKQNPEIIRLLLETRIDFILNNQGKKTPILLAANIAKKSRHWECVLAFRFQAPSPLFWFSCYQTLILAVECKQLVVAKVLLDMMEPCVLTKQTNFLKKPLLHAMENHHLKMIGLLLAYQEKLAPAFQLNLHKVDTHQLIQDALQNPTRYYQPLSKYKKLAILFCLIKNYSKSDFNKLPFEIFSLVLQHWMKDYFYQPFNVDYYINACEYNAIKTAINCYNNQWDVKVRRGWLAGLYETDQDTVVIGLESVLNKKGELGANQLEEQLDQAKTLISKALISNYVKQIGQAEPVKKPSLYSLFQKFKVISTAETSNSTREISNKIGKK